MRWRKQDYNPATAILTAANYCGFGGETIAKTLVDWTLFVKLRIGQNESFYIFKTFYKHHNFITYAYFLGLFT